MHFTFSAQVSSWDLEAQWVELDRSRAWWQDQSLWRFAQRLLWKGGDHHPAGSTTQEGTSYQPFAEQVLLHSPTRASHDQGSRAPDIWGQGWHRWHSGQQDEAGFGWPRSRNQDWTICWVPELMESGGQWQDQGVQRIWSYHQPLQGSQGYAPEPWQRHEKNFWMIFKMVWRGWAKPLMNCVLTLLLPSWKFPVTWTRQRPRPSVRSWQTGRKKEVST